jgi:predicted enzyme related to lactoylglutathione lyase
MPSPRGKFVWYDVMTSDPKPAASFYGHVIGWDAQEFPMADGSSYTVFCQGPVMAAGLMAIPDAARAMGAMPCWSGYVAVDDVDAEAKRITEAGGTIQRPPEDIPNVGRFAVAADPGGAVFLIFKPNGDETPTAVNPCDPGRVGWHELYAENPDREFAFYAKLFGWTKDTAMDMGPMGTYQMFATAGAVSGGMMKRPPQMPVSCWTYYIGVDGIDAAAARVKERGGQVMMGPQEVPGGAWIVQARDPQGAAFAMISASK